MILKIEKGARFLLRPLVRACALLLYEPRNEVLLGLLRLLNPTVLHRHLGEHFLRREEENSGRAGRTELGTVDRVADEETVPLGADHRHDAAMLDAAGLAIAERDVAALDRVRVLHIHPCPIRNGRRVALLGLPSGSQRGNQQSHREQRNDYALHRLFLLKMLFREVLAVGI